MKRFKCKKHAFLLSEHLIALSIFGIGMLLCLSILRILAQIEQRITVADEVEWHLMLTQLDSNLSGQVLQKSDYFLFLNQVKNDGVATVVKIKSDSTPKKSVLLLSKNKGYHPILIGYKMMQLYRNGENMQIDATLLQGTHFQVNFVPAKRVISVYRNNVPKTSSKKEAGD